MMNKFRIENNQIVHYDRIVALLAYLNMIVVGSHPTFIY